ncbi:MAG: hypothetical protein SGJ15_07925 [Bacteroidota bacterium]|nr:hypothetical protein [Bacteroidota bacterium]
MKIKLILFVVCLFTSNTFLSQTNYVIKTDMVIKMAMMNVKSKLTTYIKGEEVKQLTEVNGIEQHQFFSGDKINLVTKERTYKDACGEGTLDEWKELNMEALGSTVYKNFEIEKTNKTEKILGYLCKKCIFHYKIEIPISKALVEVEQEVWYSEELYEKGFKDHDPKSLGVTNPLIEALASLKGFVLKQIIKQMGGGYESVVTQIDQNPSKDPILSLEEATKGCKKMLTLKKHNKEVMGRHQMSGQMRY